MKLPLALWGAVFVIVTRYLYEEHIFYSLSGISTVIFFALLHNIRRSPESSEIAATQAPLETL
jgi:hypothetical protein